MTTLGIVTLAAVTYALGVWTGLSKDKLLSYFKRL